MHWEARQQHICFIQSSDTKTYLRLWKPTGLNIIQGDNETQLFIIIELLFEQQTDKVLSRG